MTYFMKDFFLSSSYSYPNSPVFYITCTSSIPKFKLNTGELSLYFYW